MKERLNPGSVAVLFVVLALGTGPVVADRMPFAEPENGLARVTSEIDGLPRVGTAFVVGVSEAATFLVTAAHVVSGDAAPRLRFAASPFAEHPADVVRVDEGFDLAILQVPRRLDGVRNLAFARLRARVSDPVLALGLPRRAARPWSYTGTVAAIEGVRIGLGQGLGPGFSGGPLLRDGEIVGLVQQAEGNQAYALDAIVLQAFLQGFGIPLGDSDSPDVPVEEQRQRDVSEVAAAGGIDFSGSTVRDSLLIQQPRDSTITVVQGRPQLSLQTDFASVGLGASARFRVVSRPVRAIAGRTCVWTASPRQLFESPEEGACTLDLQMPDSPVPNQPRQIPVVVSVQVLRDGEIEEELSFRGQAYNGLQAQVIVGSRPMNLRERRPVRVIDQHGGREIPEHYVCRWTFRSFPFQFEPSPKTSCRGHLTIKNPKSWGSMERSLFERPSAMSNGLWVVQVTLVTKWRKERVGEVLFSVPLGDVLTVAKAELSTSVLDRWSLGTREELGFDMELKSLGLPPSEELDAEDLELRLSLDRHRYSLRLVPAGAEGPEAVRLFEPYQGHLKAEFSLYGEEPYRAVVNDSLESLAELDTIWVRIHSKISDATAGPFRLDFEFSRLAREGALRGWADLSEHDRKSLLCRDLHQGSSSYGNLLAVVEEVRIRCEGGSRARAVRLGSSLDMLWAGSFEPLRPPVGPCSYRVEVLFLDGTSTHQSCSRDVAARRHPPFGRYYVLERQESEDPEAPGKLEIYLKHQKMLKETRWTLLAEPDFEVTHLRISHDGKSYSTLPWAARKAGRMGFTTVDEDELFLRFVQPDGREVAYAGAVSLETHQFEIERDEMLRDGRLLCTTDPKVLGDREADSSQSTIACGLQHDGVSGSFTGFGAMHFRRLQGVVRAVRFGCSRDALGTEVEVTKPSRRWVYSPWLLTVDEPCDTVYGQVIFEDNSRSEVLVAPVTGG